jgi:hypothetical protein
LIRKKGAAISSQKSFRQASSIVVASFLQAGNAASIVCQQLSKDDVNHGVDCLYNGFCRNHLIFGQAEDCFAGANEVNLW